jgi:hypothetical protein
MLDEIFVRAAGDRALPARPDKTEDASPGARSSAPSWDGRSKTGTRDPLLQARKPDFEDARTLFTTSNRTRIG